jgi:4-hydroxybenzoate polyprenyltransferase
LGTVSALWRASHPEPVVAVTAATALLSAASGKGARRAAVATAAVLAGQLLTGWTNDLIDAERDARARRRDKPVATGELPKAHVLYAMALALPWSLLLSRAAGRRGPAVHGAGIADAALYNLGLKATPLSVGPYAAAFALLPVYALDERPPTWALAAGSLLGAGAHLGQVLPDIEADRKEGVLGLPQRLGRRWSSIGIVGTLGAAAATLSLATRRPATIALAAVGTAVAAAAAAAGLKERPALGFRLTMGAAGLLVAAYSLSLRPVSR